MTTDRGRAFTARSCRRRCRRAGIRQRFGAIGRPGSPRGGPLRPARRLGVAFPFPRRLPHRVLPEPQAGRRRARPACRHWRRLSCGFDRLPGSRRARAAGSPARARGPAPPPLHRRRGPHHRGRTRRRGLLPPPAGAVRPDRQPLGRDPVLRPRRRLVGRTAEGDRAGRPAPRERPDQPLGPRPRVADPALPRRPAPDPDARVGPERRHAAGRDRRRGRRGPRLRRARARQGHGQGEDRPLQLPDEGAGRRASAATARPSPTAPAAPSAPRSTGRSPRWCAR